MYGDTFFAYVERNAIDNKDAHVVNFYKADNANLKYQANFSLDHESEKFSTSGIISLTLWIDYLVLACLKDKDLEPSNDDQLDRFGSYFEPRMSLYFFKEGNFYHQPIGCYEPFEKNPTYDTNYSISITAFNNKIFLAFKNKAGRLSVGCLQEN